MNKYGIDYRSLLKKDERIVWDRIMKQLDIDDKHHHTLYMFSQVEAERLRLKDSIAKKGSVQASESGYEQIRPEVSILAKKETLAVQLANKLGLVPQQKYERTKPTSTKNENKLTRFRKVQ